MSDTADRPVTTRFLDGHLDRVDLTGEKRAAIANSPTLQVGEGYRVDLPTPPGDLESGTNRLQPGPIPGSVSDGLDLFGEAAGAARKVSDLAQGTAIATNHLANIAASLPCWKPFRSEKWD